MRIVIEMLVARLDDAVDELWAKRKHGADLAGDLRRHAGSIEGMGGSGDVARELQAAARILEEQADLIDRLRWDLARRVDIARTELHATGRSAIGIILGVAGAFRGMLGGGGRARVGSRSLSPYPVQQLIGYRATLEQLDRRLRITFVARPGAFVSYAMNDLDLAKSPALAGHLVDVLDALGRKPGWNRTLASHRAWGPISKGLAELGLLTNAADVYGELNARPDLSTVQVVGGTTLRVGFVSTWATLASMTAVPLAVAFGAACSPSVVGAPICAAAGFGLGIAFGLAVGTVMDQIYDQLEEPVLDNIGAIESQSKVVTRQIRDGIATWIDAPSPYFSADVAPSVDLRRPVDVDPSPEPLVPTNPLVPADPGHGGHR